MSRRATILWLLAIGIAAGLLSYHTNSDWDYPEDAGPAIDALIHLRIHDFLAARPAMGPLSLLLRAPFAALSRLTEGADPERLYNDAYRFGVFPCVVASGLLGMWLARIARERGLPAIFQFGVGALCVVNPVSLRAIEVGHPEEILGAVLVVAAVVAGMRRHPWWAVALLAMAIANKQWALVAIVPVALTLAPRQIVRAAVIGVAIGLALFVPIVIVDAHNVWEVTRNMANIDGASFLPANIWWRFVALPSQDFTVGGWLAVVAHPLIIVMGFAVPLLLMGRVKEDLEGRLLPLLALVLLLRCMLDPVTNLYYHVPFFLALVAADTFAGSLIATLVATVALLLTNRLGSSVASVNFVYLCWSIPFAAYLTGRACGLSLEDVRAAFAARSRGARDRASA